MDERIIFLNGKFLSESEAKISIYDSALVFGDMVFEMTRSFNKIQFKLREHLERLFSGIKILRIPIQYTINEVEKYCYEVIDMNEEVFLSTDEHRLMINVSRGLLPMYAKTSEMIEPTVLISDFPLKWAVMGMGKLFDTGINAVIPSQRAIPAFLLEPKIKNRSRIHYQMANLEVAQMKGDNNWALLLDPDGFIAEGTGSNFFIIKDTKLITPEGHNILRGISRGCIFELARELGLVCFEKNIEAYDVYTADEAFMTGTPFCMLPVTSLNGIKIRNGEVGNITKRLIAIWGMKVGVDIVQQIKDFNQEM